MTPNDLDAIRARVAQGHPAAISGLLSDTLRLCNEVAALRRELAEAERKAEVMESTREFAADEWREATESLAEARALARERLAEVKALRQALREERERGAVLRECADGLGLEIEALPAEAGGGWSGDIGRQVSVVCCWTAATPLLLGQHLQARLRDMHENECRLRLENGKLLRDGERLRRDAGREAAALLEARTARESLAVSLGEAVVRADREERARRILEEHVATCEPGTRGDGAALARAQAALRGEA